MGFINNFKTYCGGNATLAWLLTVTVVSGLVLWLLSAICRLCGFGDEWITQWLACPSDPYMLLSRPWTLVTYMVTHLSPLHLLFNTLWLYWFGRMLADVTSDRSILMLFIGGGIAGAVIYIIFSWFTGYSPNVKLTGDSAGVLSVMAGSAVIMPNRKIGLFLLGEIKLKWIAIVCIAITVIGANGTALPPQSAHFAGILFGLIWALRLKGYFKNSKQASNPKPRKVNAKATLRAINNSISDEERLDQLLDKIRTSGYDSLSSREKTELNHISSRIQQ